MNSSQVPAIEFHDVCFRSGDKLVLNDVNFTLEPGHMTIITGASNSGKSVLLHLAIGLLRPDSGDILIEGRNIAKLNEAELLALRSSRMGIAFQEDTLFTGMSAFENAAYRLVEHNWTEQQIKPAVLEVLRFVGLERDADKLPEELSVGMRRRLEIARSLVGWPRIMLFDEPASGLDPINTKSVMDLVIRARDLHKISVLYATKAMNEIRYLAQHHASKDDTGASAIISGLAPGRPEILVMVLENGSIAFRGSLSNFEASTLPSVASMTHSDAGERVGTSFSPDPWHMNIRHKEA